MTHKPIRKFSRVATGSLATATLMLLQIGSANLFAQSTEQRAYRVIDLGPVGNPPGQPYFVANSGLVAGAAQTGGASQAVLWVADQRIDIGANSLGGPNSQAFGVNDRGQVVGEAQTSDGDGEDFCGFNAMGLTQSAHACKAFLWQHGAIQTLPNSLGGANSVANAINARGDVAGFAETNQQREGGCPVGRFAPVVWRNGSLQSLATYAADPDGIAAAINDQGQAVGATGSCAAPFNPNSQLYLLESHAVRWDADGSVHLIPGLGGDGAFGGNHACGINNFGQVVGHADVAGDAAFYGFSWTPATGTLPLYPFPGDFASGAVGVNDRGQVVGTSIDGNFDLRAMLWENGEGIDLNGRAPASPLYLLLAASINASGDIVGFGTRNGEVHGFLAIPNGVENGLLTSMPQRVGTPDKAHKLLSHWVEMRRR